MDYEEDMDADFNEHKTAPSPVCEGAIDCPHPIEVIFLRTGEKMCAEHAIGQCRAIVERDLDERAERDTDPAPPAGSSTTPPVPDSGDDDSPAPTPAPDEE